MPTPSVVPDPSRLDLLSLVAESTHITLIMRTCGDSARCPLCGRASARVHSHYQRTLADLPWAGIPARILLWTRRFFCDTPDCQRRIFTERLAGVAAPHARCTERLRAWLRRVALAVGGAPGARLLHQLGIPACGDTVLAQLHAARSPAVSTPAPTPRILSVDDFAFRRGRTYGSILVDLERHAVVDLLPDRSGDRFAAWLVGHPGVHVISRDRSSEYAHAAHRVAPQAIQVADRFHLLQNLREVVFRVCKRHARLVRHVARPGAAGAAAGTPPSLTHLRLDREASREQARVEMADRFHAIQQLAHQGRNQTAIARTLGLNWQTVHKYLTYTTPPQRSYTIRQSSALTPYQGYMLGRWASGCHNARQVWREIVAQGYPGAYRTVARLTGYLRRQEQVGVAAPVAPVGMTAGQAAGLVLVRPEQRTSSEAVALQQLGSLHPQLHSVLTHFAAFAALLRNPPGDPDASQHLAEWLQQARSSGVPELKAFAAKLGQDRDAVLAALTLPYSQGQTEGFITKLKLLKRSMYGRAQFAVLRERVLYTAR